MHIFYITSVRKSFFILPIVILGITQHLFGQISSESPNAEINIYRPKGKGSEVFTVFFNRKKVFALEDGQRINYKISSEGSLTVVVIVGTAFQEPSSKANNFRTITVEKGKSYYFEVLSKGEIKYVLNPTLGKQAFEDDKKFNTSITNLSENPNDPIPSLSIAKNIIRFQEMVKKTQIEVAKKEKEIQKKIDEYFADLKKKAKLAESVSPSVSVSVNEDGVYGGRMRYSLRATYSYEVDEKGLKAELAHYPPGKYQLPTSAAASATTSAMKETIEYYLAEYFETGSVVNIRITGSADATPIINKYYYDGEYTENIEQDYYLASNYETISKGVQVDSTKTKNKSEESYKSETVFVEKSPKKSISIKKSERIVQNEQLAFLRTMGIRYFMENDIEPLKFTKNQFIQRGKVEGTGSKFRKVIIELSIQDIFRNK